MDEKGWSFNNLKPPKWMSGLEFEKGSLESLPVEMRKYEVGLCEKYSRRISREILYRGSGNVCAVGVFVTPMDSWMCQQPTWTSTKNLCQTIYTPGENHTSK